MSDLKKNILIKTFSSLPLWAKVLIPAALVILVLSLVKTLKMVVTVGIIAVVVFAVMSGVAYFSGKNEE